YPNKFVALYGRIPNVGMVPQIDVMIRPANTYRLYLKPDLTLLQLSRLDLVRHQVSRALRNVRFVHDGYSSSFFAVDGCRRPAPKGRRQALLINEQISSRNRHPGRSFRNACDSSRSW